MSWVITAVAVGSLGYSSYQNQKGIKNAKGRLGDLNYPDYFEDPDYRETQDYLKKLGIGILDGDIPDYYKGIGETGSKEFEDMLGLTTRDIQKGAAESMALQGRGRGGQLAAVTSGSIADAATKLRYADYNRAMTGKEWLFGQGKGITEGVRGAGQQEGVNRNAFNVGEFNFEKWRAGNLAELDLGLAEDNSETAQSLAGIVSGAYTKLSSDGGNGDTSGLSILGGQEDDLATWIEQLNQEDLTGNSTLGAISGY